MRYRPAFAIAVTFLALSRFACADGPIDILNQAIDAAKTKWRQGQASLATTAAWSGVKANTPNALKQLEALAKQGDPDAMNMMGWLYDNGEYGVPVNASSAMQFFRAAANQGNEVAIYNIGVMVYHGRGVTMSVDTAYKWFTRAAESRVVVRACVRAAVLAIQRKEASSTVSGFVQCGTDRNNPTAYFLRGRIDYQAGRFDSALAWLTKAADAMEPNAPWLISRLYSQSPGLTSDNVLAAGWWAVGAKLNPKKAAINATGLDNFGLDEEQRQRANHFAEQWISTHAQAAQINYTKTIIDPRE